MRVYNERPFPDIEEGMILWASSHPALDSGDPEFRFRHVGDELPTDYQKRLPFVEISVREGGTDGLTWYPQIEFYVFDTDAKRARDLSAALFASMTVYPRMFGGVSADTVEITAWPTRSTAQEPDEDTICFAGEVTASLRR